MVIAAVTPNAPNLDGKVVKMFMAFTSAGAGAASDLDLPTDAPSIDLRVENPVIKCCIITTQTDPANSLIGTLATQVARAAAGVTDPDTDAEWKIETARKIPFYHTADEDGIGFVTYLSYGAQLQ